MTANPPPAARADNRSTCRKALLLDMISSVRSPDVARTSGLDGPDWDDICTMAIQHRVAPLLFRRSAGCPEWAIPAEAMARLKRAHAAAARRSITLVYELHRVGTLLDAASIRWAALKGAWLGLTAYPEAALRPVRDLDVLVERERAVEAYRLLLDAGFHRQPGDAISLEQAARGDGFRHLPSLVAPQSGMIVEVHTRLFDSGAREGAQRFAAAALARAQRTAVAGRATPFLSAENNALHLVAHAALDSTFDNGPLIFTDFAWLARRERVDWPGFWRDCEELGFARAARLIVALSERYHGRTEGASPPGEGDPLPPGLLAEAALLTLADYDRRYARMQRATLAAGALRQRLAAAARLAFPPGYVLRYFAGPRWRWLPLPILFPAWALARFARLVASYARGHGNAEANRAARVYLWLRS